MGVRGKICKYIKQDRPQRLKDFVCADDIDLDRVKLRRDQTVLHVCASYGSGDMLRCLLRYECDASKPDKDRNLPLHLALQRALGCRLADAEEIFSTLVKPLLQAYPMGQDVENKKGDTGRDLLDVLKDKIKKGRLSSEQKLLEDEKYYQEEDDRWKQKLEEEAQFEYEEQQPRYSTKDDDFCQRNSASFSDCSTGNIWENLKREQNHTFERYKKKIREQARRDASSSKPQKSSREDQEAEKLRQAREEMRKRFKAESAEKTLSSLQLRKQRYEKKFTHLLSNLSGKTLTFGCIPWPHSDLNQVTKILFSDIADKRSDAYRKYLRSQQVRWHPDKFTQKFGDHLHPGHTPKIMARVKAISQLLNKLDSERTK